ncbi:hypothetical protein GQ600_3359 [Phytophthora cactorum]|nr:hypothetical protein GQ600_3359 [Phytophthora cactorum]
MKTMESDMAALELDIDAAFETKVEIGGGNSSSSRRRCPKEAQAKPQDRWSQHHGIRHRKALALATPTDELKREKNRDSVKRSYYRKIVRRDADAALAFATLGELRAHTEYLREQYNRLLAQWEDKTEREKAETAKDPSSLMKRYLELSRLRDRLWMENTQLHEQFEDREKISFRFQRLFDVNYQLMDHSIAAPIEEENQDRRVQTPMLIMDEMSFESFNKFAQDAQRTFEAFVASRHHMITTDTALGWTCSHVAKDNSFGYYFEKTFGHSSYTSAAAVARTAWQTLTSPERHSKLYAPALHTRFHVMQQFDNNSYVLYRTMEKEGEDSITTALIIMTRIPHPNDSGCLIICKGLRREEHTLHVEFSEAIALQKKKEWRQSMYWINIEEVPVDDNNNSEEVCEENQEKKLKVVHGGIMNNMGDPAVADAGEQSGFPPAQALNETLNETDTQSLLDMTLEPLEELQSLGELEAIEPLPLVAVDEPPAGREKRLLQLARARKALYEENESLRDRKMNFAKAYGSLQHLVDVHAEDDDENSTMSKRTQLMVWRKFKIDECFEINRVAYGRIMADIEKQRHKPHKGTTLGWTDRRRLDDGVMSYCFSKLFANRSSSQLAENTWQLATDMKRTSRFFSVFLNVDVHIVQHVDINNVVCMRTVNQADHDVVLKSLYLLTRFETEKGIIILVHGLDPRDSRTILLRSRWSGS